jgi:hypothetical protein
MEKMEKVGTADAGSAGLGMRVQGADTRKVRTGKAGTVGASTVDAGITRMV